jgi:hypothetical protein
MELEVGSEGVGGGRSTSRGRASDGGPHPACGADGHESRCDGLAPGIEAHHSGHVGDHVDEEAGRDEAAWDS